MDLDENIGKIIEQTLKRCLQKIRPCFMTRLAEFTDEIVIFKNTVNLHTQYPFNSKKFNFSVFYKLFPLISDKKEFANIYQKVVSRRLLGQLTHPEIELFLIEDMDLGDDMKLMHMIKDMKNSTPHIRLVDDKYWDLHAEGEDLFLNEILTGLIKKEIDTFDIMKDSGKYFYYNEGKKRNLRFSRGFSRITIMLGRQKWIMNLSQYLILDCLINEGGVSSFEKIKSKTLLGDSNMKSQINSLIRHKIVIRKQVKEDHFLEICSLLINKNKPIDISEVKFDKIGTREIDIQSYLQGIIFLILKKDKKAAMEKLYNKVVNASKVKITKESIYSVVGQLIEKGICEKVDNHIQYLD